MTSQKNKIRLFFYGILVLIVLSAIFDFPSYYNQFASSVKSKLKIPLPEITGKPFLLGLDLQGGTHLVYEADVTALPESQRGDAVEGVKDVLDRRVNAFGVSEPVIQSSRSGDRWNVIVELAGVRDVNQAIQMIGETPQLDFRIQATSTVPSLTDEEKKELLDFNESAKKLADSALNKALAKNANFDDLAKELSQEPGAVDTLGKLGFQKKGIFVPEFEKACFDDITIGEIKKELTETAFGYHIIKKLEEKGEGDAREVNCQHILIRTKNESDIHPVQEWIPTQLSGEHLKRTQVIFDPNSGTPQVSLEFNEEGQEIFKNLTTENVGRIIGIFLDGNLISAPRVNEPILAGNAVISGSFGVQEAKLLSQRLNAGALKVPIKLVSQQTIGPTLGKASIEKSVNAAILGLIIVCIFMVLFYRIPGIIADISLLTYGFILLALFKIIPVTLTLAGISGFILSIGMAVDANILVFERFKEELRRKKSIDVALDEAFRRAWPSIRDGNYSTILTCVILMWFSTSVVKGFAITLIIGILVSIFTAMFVTKVFLKIIIKKGSDKWLWMYGINKKKI